MTGMLISGKMSVGVRSKTTGVRRMITRAITINVYGRCSAKRTIHILVFEFLFSDDAKRSRSISRGKTAASLTQPVAEQTNLLAIRPRQPCFWLRPGGQLLWLNTIHRYERNLTYIDAEGTWPVTRRIGVQIGLGVS